MEDQKVSVLRRSEGAASDFKRFCYEMHVYFIWFLGRSDELGSLAAA